MNCPWCTELNLNYKTIALGGVYVCENELCAFCESEESFRATYIDHSEQTPTNDFSSKSPVHEELLQISESEINGFNKYCLDTMSFDNINVMNRNDIKLDSDSVDKQVLAQPIDINDGNFEKSSVSVNESITQQITQTNIVNKEKNDFRNIIQNLDEIEIVELEVISEEINSSIYSWDISKEIIYAGNESTIKTNRKKSKIQTDTCSKPKLRVINPSLSASLDLSFYNYNNKVFNWLRMPYLMKTHSKIIRILLLHLDVFKFTNGTDIDDIKREYSVCETIANQFRIDTIRPLCYPFLNKLYNVIDKIPDKNLVGKEMDERVVRLLRNLFDKYDLPSSSSSSSSSSLKFEYKTELRCSHCGSEKSTESKDCILLMECNKSHLKIQKNKLVYEINCLKCKNKLTKTVVFKRVPEFVIFHCPKGLKENICKYENKIVTNDGRKLSLVAVVESGSKYPFVEVPENQMNWHIYDICDTVMDTRCRPSYAVHFRNKFGWFSLNGYKQFLCSPQETLSICSLSDVRFVVFGEISDPRIYRQQLNIQDLIDKYEENFKKSISERIEKPQVDLHNDTVIQNSNKNRSKPKKKLKKWIKSEENIRQFPRILKKINCDFEDDTQNENKIISFTNAENSTISNKKLFSPSNHQILARNIEVRNVSGGNISSSELSASSLMENNISPLKRKRKNDENLSQSASSFSSNFSQAGLKSKPQSELFNIDDLITKQCKKINQNLK